MQTIYRLAAHNPLRPAEEPIVSLHTDYDVVMRMAENMAIAGWFATIDYSTVIWRELVTDV